MVIFIIDVCNLMEDVMITIYAKLESKVVDGHGPQPWYRCVVREESVKKDVWEESVYGSDSYSMGHAISCLNKQLIKDDGLKPEEFNLVIGYPEGFPPEDMLAKK